MQRIIVKKILLILCILQFLNFTGCSANKVIKSAAKIFPIAHRGCHREFYGNSRPAIECAVKEGLIVEIDIRESKDHKLFLFHDKRLSSEQPIELSANIQGQIFSELSDNVIEKLCFKDKTLGCVLSFEEGLKILKQTSATYLLDLKEWRNIYESTYYMVAKHKLLESVIFNCYNQDCINSIKKLSDGRDLKFLFVVKKINQLNEAIEANPYGILLDPDWLTTDLIDRMKEKGIKIIAKSIDTEDNEKIWSQLLDKGVDLAMTDNPVGFLKWKFEGSQSQKIKIESK